MSGYLKRFAQAWSCILVAVAVAVAVGWAASSAFYAVLDAWGAEGLLVLWALFATAVLAATMARNDW